MTRKKRKQKKRKQRKEPESSWQDWRLVISKPVQNRGLPRKKIIDAVTFGAENRTPTEDLVRFENDDGEIFWVLFHDARRDILVCTDEEMKPYQGAGRCDLTLDRGTGKSAVLKE